MDVDITDESENTIEFDLTGANPAAANALRRMMIGKVPTMAIEDVTFTKNSSGLFDEIVAHRLGLIPWEFEPDKYNRRDECDCEGEEGCPQCTVTFVLDKEGEGIVTAADMQPTDEDVEPANPDTKIVDLQEDGKIKLEAVAQLGTGQEHAKWQAANAAYSYEKGDDTFHFTVESVSGLDPRTIVQIAIQELKDELDAFEDQVA